MVRKLALAVSLALGTLSVPVHALGLGELSSKSALNQNFSGDITLLSVRPEELDAVRVRLGDAEAFKRAGVDRPFYLSLFKFEPALTSRGKPVIRISSDFPVREPFLNFLVEVNWPNGRLLREYTVLLDPPTTTRRRPPKIAPAVKKAKAVAPPPVTQKVPAPTPAGSKGTGGYEYGPVVANETAWSIAKEVRPGGVSMEQMMMALLNANSHAFVDGNINRLRKGRILRVPSLTEIRELGRQQARQAYREQQDEWLAQRNEKLQAAAEKAASEEAAVEGSAAGAAETSDQLRIATARPEGEGEAGAGDDDALSATASDLKSRLIVARENAETSRQEAETLRSQVDDLQVRLENMQKLLSLKDDQLAGFQDRIATNDSTTEITETPAGTEAAATGEAESTAAEPAPQVADEAAEPVVETTEQPEAVAEDEVVTEVAEGTAEVMTAPQDYAIQDIAPQIDPDLIVMGGGVEEPLAEEVPTQIDPDLIVEQAAARIAQAASESEQLSAGTDAAETEIVVEEAPADEAVTIDAAADAATEPVAAAPEPAPAPTVEETSPEAPASASPIMEMIEKNMVPIAAGGISLLALLGWLFSRRGRKEEETSGPAPVAASEIAAATPEPEPAVDEPVMDADALSELPDSSFLDEFSPSDINALQDETGEVDPVSEADVYIAYGRYQQAEEMLKQAMSRDPDRLALKHKLLDVHYATRNAGAFAALAQEMVDSGQDTADEPAWARTREMGRELAPDNALFSLRAEDGAIAGLDEDVGTADQVTATEAEAPAASVDEDTLALGDLELSELTADFDDDKGKQDDLEIPSEVSISLDLDEPSGLSATLEEIEPPESIELDDLEALDVELPKVELDGMQPETEDTISDSLDLDSMMAEAEAAVAGNESLSLDSEFSADELQAQLDELSDLSVLDSSEATEVPEVPEPPAGLGLVAEDSGTVDGTLDQPINLDEAFDVAQGDEVGADVVDIGVAAAPPAAESVSEDEVATKLDLARAYVEMGDADGARAILEEVVAEGSNTQRGDAETLLSRLG